MKKPLAKIRQIMFAYPAFAEENNKVGVDDPEGDEDVTISPAFGTRPDYDPFYSDFVDYLRGAPNNVTGTFPKNRMQTMTVWGDWISFIHGCQK